MRDFRVAIMAISEAAKNPLAMMSDRIVAASNQILSGSMTKILLSGEAGYRTGALAQFCDLVETAQIVKNPRWSGGLDIDGCMLLKLRLREKASPLHYAVQGSMFKIQGKWGIEPLNCLNL
jgi:hypothetical protein